MANYPSKFQSQFGLQPGARGEKFIQDIPGYRNQGGRINRTNNTLNTSKHDVTNITYSLDSRLPVLFRYGFAYGFNQIVVTKGRIVSVDPFRSVIDFEDKKPHNILTIANGGNDVDLNGDNWSAAASPYVFDEATGLDKVNPKTRRPGNTPIGIIMRNEYTRNDDAFNGISPGAVLTDCFVELPWFQEQAKAELNPWGSAYGDFKPGELVKSDENGRFITSPLNDPTTFFAGVTDVSTMSEKMALYEKERQQVIGQVYETFPELVPAGAPIFAQWALSDRMNFDEFNPDEYRQNNRDGEDSIPNSPYNSTGEYPGSPYEEGYMAHDLHMINSREAGGRGGVYDRRMQLEYQMRDGIPGLTDGYNAYQKFVPNTELGVIGIEASAANPVTIPKGQRYVYRTLEVNLEKTVVDVSKIADKNAFDAKPQTIANDIISNFRIDYIDNLQGLIGITFDEDVEITEPVTFYCSYTKRGKSGVPTNLDWDGCKGTVKILLQK